MSTSSTSPMRIRSFLADGAITQYTFVTFGTDNEHVAANTTGAGKVRGIAQSAATAAGDTVEVALPGGGGLLKVNETITAGNYLASTTSGLGELADAAGEHVGAVAQEDGVQNDVIDVEVTSFETNAADA